MTTYRGRGVIASIALAVALLSPAAPALAVDLHLVTVTVQPTTFDPPGSGTITSDDGAINCVVTYGAMSGTCSHSYLVATSATVSLTWAPAPGSNFCVGLQCDTTPYQQTREYTASTTVIGGGFKAVSAHLAVHIIGDGQLEVSGTPAIDGDVLPFAVPANLTISAIPGAGFAWTSFGGICAGQGQPCIAPFKADASVTVTFQAIAASPTAATPRPTSKPTPRSTTSTPTPAASAADGGSGTRAPSQAVTTATPVAGPSSTPDPARPSGDAGATAPLVVVIALLLAVAGLGIGLALGRRQHRKGN